MVDREPKDKANNETIQLLPFTYVRVDDPSFAQYSHFRISGVQLVGGPPNQPRSDETIVGWVKEEFEKSQWFYTEYWRKKGQPKEQVEFQVGEKTIILYNFNGEIPFTDEHITKAANVLAEFASRFPKVIDKIDWILIDDVQPSSYYGDSVNYPSNGQAAPNWNAFKLHPRGMEFTPHRITAATNFEGTLVHELGHLIDDQFEKAGWFEKYKWEPCLRYPEDWEYKDVPDGEKKAFYNKKTGKMALVDLFALQPQECVTEYAAHNIDDDVCESLVAYFFDQDLLRTVSSTKFEIIQSQDANLQKPLVTITRVPTEEIRLPEIKPQVVNYFIKEPQI